MMDGNAEDETLDKGVEVREGNVLSDGQREGQKQQLPKEAALIAKNSAGEDSPQNCTPNTPSELQRGSQSNTDVNTNEEGRRSRNGESTGDAPSRPPKHVPRRSVSLVAAEFIASNLRSEVVPEEEKIEKRKIERLNRQWKQREEARAEAHQPPKYRGPERKAWLKRSASLDRARNLAVVDPLLRPVTRTHVDYLDNDGSGPDGQQKRQDGGGGQGGGGSRGVVLFRSEAECRQKCGLHPATLKRLLASNDLHEFKYRFQYERRRLRRMSYKEAPRKESEPRSSWLDVPALAATYATSTLLKAKEQGLSMVAAKAGAPPGSSSALLLKAGGGGGGEGGHAAATAIVVDNSQSQRSQRPSLRPMRQPSLAVREAAEKAAKEALRLGRIEECLESVQRVLSSHTHAFVASSEHREKQQEAINEILSDFKAELGALGGDGAEVDKEVEEVDGGAGEKEEAEQKQKQKQKPAVDRVEEALSAVQQRLDLHTHALETTLLNKGCLATAKDSRRVGELFDSLLLDLKEEVRALKAGQSPVRRNSSSSPLVVEDNDNDHQDEAKGVNGGFSGGQEVGGADGGKSRRGSGESSIITDMMMDNLDLLQGGEWEGGGGFDESNKSSSERTLGERTVEEGEEDEEEVKEPDLLVARRPPKRNKPKRNKKPASDTTVVTQSLSSHSSIRTSSSSSIKSGGGANGEAQGAVEPPPPPLALIVVVKAVYGVLGSAIDSHETDGTHIAASGPFIDVTEHVRTCNLVNADGSSLRINDGSSGSGGGKRALLDDVFLGKAPTGGKQKQPQSGGGSSGGGETAPKIPVLLLRKVTSAPRKSLCVQLRLGSTGLLVEVRTDAAPGGGRHGLVVSVTPDGGLESNWPLDVAA